MTTEKAVEVLETTRLMYEMSLDDSDCDEDSAEAREDNEETIEAINEAIKALKRGDVLDKIRAEIKRLPYQRLFGRVNNYFLLDTVIEIIDKYRESEGE